MLTIGHANVHNRRQGVRVLTRRGRGCDSVGVNEGHKLNPWLLGLRGYRTTVAQGHVDPRSAETPILTRKVLPGLGELALQVAEAATPLRVAPARWLTASLYRHPDVGPVAHVNVHLHWIGPAWDRPQLARVVEYDESARSLTRVCRLLLAEGFATVVTGDVNVPRDGRSPGWETAYEALERAGMVARTVGRLDAIAWHPEQLRLRHLEVLPRQRLDSDHPGLVARLVRP